MRLQRQSRSFHQPCCCCCCSRIPCGAELSTSGRPPLSLAHTTAGADERVHQRGQRAQARAPPVEDGAHPGRLPPARAGRQRRPGKQTRAGRRAGGWCRRRRPAGARHNAVASKRPAPPAPPTQTCAVVLLSKDTSVSSNNLLVVKGTNNPVSCRQLSAWGNEEGQRTPGSLAHHLLTCSGSRHPRAPIDVVASRALKLTPPLKPLIPQVGTASAMKDVTLGGSLDDVMENYAQLRDSEVCATSRAGMGRSVLAGPLSGGWARAGLHR